MTEAERRERARDEAYWAQLHVRSDKSKPVFLPDRIRRRVRGHGLRFERGKKCFEEERN